jgi:phenylacetate-coenzyme A ligase PaaK-like adenylate-forming protein
MHDNPVDRLIFQGEPPFEFSPEADERFFEAMKHAFRHHYGSCDLYRRLCDYRGFTPAHLDRYEAIERIPYLFVTVLKERVFMSVPPEKIALTLTSSGTTGQKSAIYLDRTTLRRIRQIVWNIYASFSMADRGERVNYLCFSYDPRTAGDLGTAWSDRLLTRLTRVNRIEYALTYDPPTGHYSLDREACHRALERYSHSRFPLRLVGFPSFLSEFMGDYVRGTGRRFAFGARSFVIIGGGWKTLQDREIPRSVFRHEVSSWLGIPPENVRDLFGMVEHGVPYCECERGNFHVPLYSRVFVRDPVDLSLLGEGETGLLHFLTPYLHSFPAISLLTTDLGRLHRRCTCGRNGPIIEIQGRGGTRKHRGCAIAALDILKKKV